MGTNAETTIEELERYINVSPKLRKGYLGHILNPTDDEIDSEKSKLKEGKFIIILKDSHWIAIFMKNGKIYEFDTFGRDLLGDGFEDHSKKQLQKITEYNCGQRTLNYLEKHL